MKRRNKLSSKHKKKKKEKQKQQKREEKKREEKQKKREEKQKKREERETRRAGGEETGRRGPIGSVAAFLETTAAAETGDEKSESETGDSDETWERELKKEERLKDQWKNEAQ